MPNKVDIPQDISLLYELSLAVESSLDVKANCQHFLQVLMAKVNFSYASVWIREDLYVNIDTQNYVLSYATPSNKVSDIIAENDNFVRQILYNRDYIVVHDIDDNFQKVIQEKNITSGTYVIYKLKNIGYLKLHIEDFSQFSDIDFEAFVIVIKKFAVGLSGCLVLEKLKHETKDRIRTQEALAATQEKYSSVVKNLAEGIIITDLEGRISFMNPKMEELTGYTSAEVLGLKTIDIFLAEELRPFVQKKLKERSQGIAERYEIEHTHKNGHTWIASINASPFLNEKGEIIGTLGAIMDVTERKKAEQDLIKAKQTAEKARFAEQQFLANMSHEIRTPINAVVGMTHLLYSTQLDNNQRELVDALRYSADSLMGIVNNILDISKIEAKELQLEKKEFNLNALVNGVGQVFQYRLKEKSIALEITTDPRIDNYLIGDPVRLKQILFNLLGNALKFTDKGKIGINTKLLAQTNDSSFIQFKIFDTGVGIAKSKLKVIFKSFKQGDVSVTRKYGGTGLGLAIVKQLVELQKGSIHVESVLKKGSEFIITLPFEDSERKLGEETENLDYGFDCNNNEFIQQLHFLVVEDNIMNQKLAQKILEHWGTTFDIVNNGREAVNITKKEKFDIILMDVHMPIMDGFTATLKIRNDDKNPNQHTHIVALTAAAFVEEKNKAKEVGMNDFLTKPFSPLDLCRVLQKLEGAENANLEHTKKGIENQHNPTSFDLSKLRTLVKNDASFVKDMIQIFLKDVPDNITLLEEAYKQENWLLMADLAHKVKSNFMLMGMTDLHQAALTIESALRLGNLSKEEIHQLVNQIVVGTKTVVPELEVELAKVKAA